MRASAMHRRWGLPLCVCVKTQPVSPMAHATPCTPDAQPVWRPSLPQHLKRRWMAQGVPHCGKPRPTGDHTSRTSVSARVRSLVCAGLHPSAAASTITKPRGRMQANRARPGTHATQKEEKNQTEPARLRQIAPPPLTLGRQLRNQAQCARSS